MAKIDVRDITAGQQFDKTLALDEHIVLLTPDLSVEEEDLQLLQQWKIKNLELLDEVKVTSEEGTASGAGGTDGFDNYKEESQFYHKALENILSEVDKFFQEIKTRGSGKLKPVSDLAPELISIIKRNRNLLLVMVNQRLGESLTMAESALYTAIYALILGMHLKLEDNKLTFIYECAILINISMLRREAEIVINKADKLSPADLQLIRTHPSVSALMVREKLRLPPIYAVIVETHHENIDGSGYPKGLAGDKIPVYSKILSVAAEFVALGDDKPYRKKVSLHQAMRIIVGDGRKKFDPRILQMLLANLSLYPLGSAVELSDGVIGVVVASNGNVPMRPVVRALLGADKKPLAEKKNLDLLQEKTISIKRSVDDEVERQRIYTQL